MNTPLRVLVGLVGIVSILIGLLFMGGGQLFDSIMAAEGIYLGQSLFTILALSFFVIGGLGTYGAFAANKLCCGIFLALLLFGWPIGTIYSAICFLIMITTTDSDENQNQEQNQEQTQ
ncbi:hypothetical protein [Photobacterium jeanii]|uniref:hypothetical protein n=1 Tax=Photobacterium jeanii TaxID=858640 RepID=UPI00082DBCA8|nr:hypothetical protein [Photobacterium jeanii]